MVPAVGRRIEAISINSGVDPGFTKGGGHKYIVVNIIVCRAHDLACKACHNLGGLGHAPKKILKN